MAKTQEMKGELSPATAVIVIVVAALIIGTLGWLFFFRQTAPMPVTGTPSGVSTMQGPPMPPPPGAPAGTPTSAPGAPAPPAAPTK